MAKEHEDEGTRNGAAPIETETDEPEVEIETAPDVEVEVEADPGDERLADGGEGVTPEVAADDTIPKEEKERREISSRDRRLKRRAKEKRIREERDYLLQQNRDILQRLAQVESTALEARQLTVDSRLTECLNDADTAERLELDAQKAGDDEGVRTARRIREQAQSRASVLKSEKERLDQALSQRKSQPVTSAPIPGADEIQKHSAQFRVDKPWIQFGSNGSPANAETAVAVAIDHALRREGRLHETDAGYWAELDKRVKAALPHLSTGVNSEDDDLDDEDEFVEVAPLKNARSQQAPPRKVVAAASARKGPQVGTSGRQGNAGTVRTRLSAERVQALKDIGVWDDPKQRSEYIKEYEKYDREHSTN